MDVKIEASWKEALRDEFKQDWFKDIVLHLKTEREQGKTIYPPGPLIFNAFEQTPLPEVKAVILGQDPYHGPHQAMGLSFSVQPTVRKPPSLVNIFQELHDDLGVAVPPTGDLTPWAKAGVLMLNASLTVRAAEPMSHAKIGWHRFTDAVIKTISDEKKHVVFILWGKFAQEKESLIDHKKHLILKAAHPSPYSAHAGFLGSKPFSKTNHWLASKGIEPINWSLASKS